MTTRVHKVFHCFLNSWDLLFPLLCALLSVLLHILPEQHPLFCLSVLLVAKGPHRPAPHHKQNVYILLFDGAAIILLFPWHIPTPFLSCFFLLSLFQLFLGQLLILQSKWIFEKWVKRSFFCKLLELII